MRTRVKICGITRIEDALAVAESGADSIGLVFYEKSPRNVSIDQAKAIVDALPPFVTVTALFLDAERVFVEQVIEKVGINLLQFHGKERHEDCLGFNLPFIKAIGMRDRIDTSALATEYPLASGFLLDSHGSGEAGGTGEAFDWSLATKTLGKPLILAGGLRPENVAEAIRTVRPWAVDLSSGVESAPGIKDRDKIFALMNEVMGVDGG